MTDHWQQVEKICQAALELEESRRAAFLEEACKDDEELRREVESLLKYWRTDPIRVPQVGHYSGQPGVHGHPFQVTDCPTLSQLGPS